ncbi:putative 60S ribosomal protein L27a-3 [Monocercomonoides exilis]|uniref:putative 60S ribosomal protein L27a-3 n=1 Tax=Monocercomonoides exilis TaxID=2049356 RepID=UPI003559774D|nr:putative 60S ribosomal protein L27a-3 [Monocercomonoides exilis]KAH7827723.1 putative 60S ribosomal protein L27a-3 [Monocercomonoides exilis]KAH7828151.1 putative 60S ribosomal protein L27a-3 [Monocercomonoides exilis]|eukprot:MONOS_219.1-p1 / transcript=MONOS_219.1 / gene=MONOS_219 / organism=Monocercomonoides_exilis_PA203 / gene_product=60S ribosomal protein L27a-3 / transcript_product=60S ribosomal protein L27a-3 / location=Mono_scaffold00003:312862-313372(+) / protein_length=151 / sequence_SO=supercontig / SO=protein_coding / is_pseudo=false
MVTRLRQTRKKRGQVTMGYGRVGKHRKHPSGRGNVGAFSFHRILFAKYHPDYVGKVGQRHFHRLPNREYCPTVNVDTLWSLVSEQKRKRIRKGKMPVIDVVRAGYFKVLGKGRLPKIPVCVRARSFSKEAARKIRATGGLVQILSHKKKQ